MEAPSLPALTLRPMMEVVGASVKTKYQSPQEKINKFWKDSIVEPQLKATRLLPPKKGYPSSKAKGDSVGADRITPTSFEDAAAQCRTKVARIVEECRRVNQRYRDPHFDIERDFLLHQRDCLDGLMNTKRTKQAVPAHGNGLEPRAVKRVPDIFEKPSFFPAPPSAKDVVQAGSLGNCWLLAGLCAMATKPGLIERICIARDEAVGVYGFVFHRDGDWFSEVVDDWLYLKKPNYNDASHERSLWDDRRRKDAEGDYRRTYQADSAALYFSKCRSPNATWLPLLEKAYAKAHGDYGSLDGGNVGEAIEDLAGGVHSTVFTADILDREHFWKEELMKVNQEFLLACGCKGFGRGTGERRGILEDHAYGVMKAVEVDGLRLVLLQNPWGEIEWKGPWSDGSEEWTPEMMTKLGHKFGDDGAFWISYSDLLRTFDYVHRTRLLGPEWGATATWTTVPVPWMGEYHSTKFAFKLARPRPVVLSLTQLDARYFRGLEGQYTFLLSFRLHRAGNADDQIVQAQPLHFMERSVSVVDLELEAGEYVVLARVDACRDESIMPPEDVVRIQAGMRQEKLARIALAYDLAHSKGRIVETAEEKEARRAARRREREREKGKLKRAIMAERRLAHHQAVRALQDRRKRAGRAKEKLKAKTEKQAGEKAKEAKAEQGQPPGDEIETGRKPTPPQTSKGGLHGARIGSAAQPGPIDSDSDLDSISSVSDVSDRTLELMLDYIKTTPQPQQGGSQGAPQHTPPYRPRPPSPPPRPPHLSPRPSPRPSPHHSPRPSPSPSPPPPPYPPAPTPTHQPAGVPPLLQLVQLEKNPWSAVAVIGLRVHYRLADGEGKDTDVVSLRVERPAPSVEDDERVSPEPSDADDCLVGGGKQEKNEGRGRAGRSDGRRR